jgi:hypothetical protein
MVATLSRPTEVASDRSGGSVVARTVDYEARSLSQQLSELSDDDCSLAVTFDGTSVDPHWIARPIVHDATHHPVDIARLRSAL